MNMKHNKSIRLLFIYPVSLIGIAIITNSLIENIDSILTLYHSNSTYYYTINSILTSIEIIIFLLPIPIIFIMLMIGLIFSIMAIKEEGIKNLIIFLVGLIEIIVFISIFSYYTYSFLNWVP